jgi:hypothetical protein
MATGTRQDKEPIKHGQDIANMYDNELLSKHGKP